MILGQADHIFCQGVHVLRRKEQAVHLMVYQTGHAAHPGGNGGAVPAGALGQGVGEALGERGQHIHVQGGVEAVGVLDPAGKDHGPRRTELPGKGLHLLPQLAVTGNDKPGLGADLHGFRKAPDQSGHILHGIDAGGDAEDGHAGLRFDSQAPQIGLPVQLRRREIKGDAVEDHKGAVRVEAPLVEHIHRNVGDADPVVHLPQSMPVDLPVGQGGKGPSHIVLPVVAVDGGDRGESQLRPQQAAHQVGLGAVAVDQLKALLPDHGLQLGDSLSQAARNHKGGNAQGLCFLHKGAIRKADQQDLLCFGQPGQQRVDVGFRAAHVAA